MKMSQCKRTLRQDSSMTTIISVNRLKRSADAAKRTDSAERLSLLTKFIVVIDELHLKLNKLF